MLWYKNGWTNCSAILYTINNYCCSTTTNETKYTPEDLIVRNSFLFPTEHKYSSSSQQEFLSSPWQLMSHFLHKLLQSHFIPQPAIKTKNLLTSSNSVCQNPFTLLHTRSNNVQRLFLQRQRESACTSFNVPQQCRTSVENRSPGIMYYYTAWCTYKCGITCHNASFTFIAKRTAFRNK